MKIILLAISVFLITISVAFAQPVGSIDNECQQHGFSEGIVKFECNSYVADEGNATGFNIDWVNEYETSDCNAVYWSSDQKVTGIVTKEGQISYIHEGGLSGIVNKTEKYAISHITFCESEPNEEVPEFSPLAGLGLLAGVGAFIYFKRK